MAKRLASICVLLVLALTQRPQAQGSLARIFFVDIGQGAGTLIVSPTGKTLLVDGGPPGGGTKIATLLDTLGIVTIDYTVLTHYHIDHDSGLIELLNAGRVAGIAYDNGDGADVQPPGTSTSSSSTRGTYLNYVAATGHPEVSRLTIAPGQVIDLGGGMRVTCLAAAGHLLSGGSVTITNDDLNTESISLLVEYNAFDFIVSGDLTGGGSTSTARTPAVETYVGQLAGDVDVAQLNHHGSTTTSNQVYLSAVKAEVAVAQIGSTNTFGHPNRETANKYLNTPATGGNVYTGTGIPTPGTGPVFYQPEESPSGDERVSLQGYSGASAANAGNGTILLETDGSSTYSLKSFDDGGVRINPVPHTYAVDGVSAGVTTDFPPTVIVQNAPVAPLASDTVPVSAAVNDRESPIAGVTLNYALNGIAQTPVTMSLVGSVYQATIPAQPDGTRVELAVSGTTGSQTTVSSSGYFSGTTPIAMLRALNSLSEPLYNSFAARIQGTITAGSNTFSAGTNDDYIQDGTGGINVFRSTDTATTFSGTTPGQVAEVIGRVGFNGGRLRLDITESIEKSTSPFGINVVSPGPPPTPAAVTISALNANPESFEGQFVSIANCQIVSGTIPATPQTVDRFVGISDGTGQFSLKIDHDTDIEGFTPGTTFAAVGIIQQDDFLRPFDSGYDIAPRGRPDLGGSAAGATVIDIASARIDAINNVDGTPGTDFIPDLLNQLVKIHGAVTSIDFRGGNGIEYYVQDATGGIDLFNSTQNFGPFSIGDSVEAVGTVTQFNGLTELTVTTVTGLTPGTVTAATAQLVTLSQLADGGVGESLEGRLIRVDNVTITSGAFPLLNSDSSPNPTITDATGSAALRIDKDTNIDGTPTPVGTFSVTGVLGQFDPSSPFDGGYQLFPRSLADITVSGASAITPTPSSFDFGSVSVGGTSFTSITITNTGGSTVTLTPPFTLSGTNADQFSVGAPVTTTLGPGASTTVSVTFLPTATGSKTATLNITSSNGSGLVALTGNGQATVGSGTPVVISEFRTRGPSGGNDEFVEIYNNTDAAIDIGTWKMNGSNSAATTSTRATVPAGTMLPARGHYLLVNNAAGGYSGAVPGNQTYSTGITDDGGIAILRPDNTTVDQVGMSTGSLYKEGTTPLAPLTTNVNRSYERKLGSVNGSQQDTNDNSSDFQLLSPSDPQSLSSMPTPAIAVSPTSINFGSVVVGGMATVNVTITNLSSTASVTLTTPFTLGGANAASFSAGLPSATTIASGSSTIAPMIFQPPNGGAHSATLTVATVGTGAVTIDLSGTAAGGISVDPASVDFGTEAVGSVSGSSLTISADTTVTLTPPFSISGTNAAEFFVGSPSTTTIEPGNDATVSVGFQPTTVGPKSASLLFTSVDGGSRTVPLSGNVACPVISISGSLPGGVVGAAYSQTLVASGGTDPYVFTTSAGGLPPGLVLSSTGTVMGSPTTAGVSSVTIHASDGNGCFGESSFTIGIVAASLTTNPTNLNFNVVTAGSPVSLPVTITNTSSFPVTLITPFAITGTGAAQFSAGSPAANALGAGASTTVQLTMTPTAAGAATASLSVTSSNGGSASVALAGTGRQLSVAGAIVISELRFRGSGGASDEFIELYNNSAAPFDISGFQLRGSNNAGIVTTRTTVPAGAIIAAHGHYLFVNAAAPASLVELADRTYGTGFTDDGGVAIAQSDATLLDQVGLSAGSAYAEGTSLASLTTNQDRSYERRSGGASGSGVDTNDNASDFQLLSPSAPQNLASIITPALSVSPGTIDFGSTARGTIANATVTITNAAAQALTLSTPMMVSGSNASDFSVGLPASATVAPGSATTAAVMFQPTTLGSKSATLTISSASGETHIVNLSGLSSCPLIGISAALPNIEAGQFYSQTLTADGGNAPYSFEVASGSVPAGISLSAGGVLSGTTTALGVFAFTAKATDAAESEGAACSGSAMFSVTVADTVAPTISVTVPANGAVYQLNQSVAASYTCADGGSGVVSCAGPVASGAAIDTSTLGAKTFTVDAADATGHSATATVTYDVRRTLSAAGPAKIWLGLKNSDDVGLRVDLRTELLVNGVMAASGELDNIDSGSSGFNNALLQSVATSLSSGPVDVPANAQLAVRISARRTCFAGGSHNSGRLSEWYNGLPIDTGSSRDAGSRITVTLAGVSRDYFLRSASGLSTAAGSARQSADLTINSATSCPARPFVSFGVWTVSLP